MLGINKHPKNRFLLVYGSATGQAEAICEEIADKAANYGLQADLYPLEMTGKRFNLEEESCVVIVTSTTGDGDPPPNAEKFMRRLKKRTLTSTYLAHLHYALLGLGDTNYTNFCRCARDMDERLLELGAQHFYPTGLADDGVGLEVVADPWLGDLYTALQEFLEVSHDQNVPVTETVKPCCDVISAMKNVPENSKLTSGAVNGKYSSTIDSNGHSTTTSVVGNLTSGMNSVDLNGVGKNSTINDTATSSLIKPLEGPGLNCGDSTQTENVDKSMIENNLRESCEISEATTILDSNAVNSEIAPFHLEKYSEFFDKLRVGETPCVSVPMSATSHLSTPLTVSDSELCEKSLNIPVVPPHYLEAKFTAQFVELSSLPHQNGCKLPSAASDVIKVKVTAVNVLTHPEAVKKTIRVRLDLQDSDIDYFPGDSVSVICPNNSSEVDLLLDRLCATSQADQCVCLSVFDNTKKRRAAVPPHIHGMSTLRHILTTCVNIRETPSKAFIRALVEYTTDPHESRRLQELCSREGAQVYTRIVREKHITLLDLLYAFPSCSPPVERLLEHLPRLQPRPYSACSYQDKSSQHLDIVFNVVEISASHEDGHFYQRRGVCTGWLDDMTQTRQKGQDMTAGETVEISIFLRTNQHFRPPEELSSPVLMVGPGTGVAPFIGFLQQRALQSEELSTQEESSYGDTRLFFGCRNKDKDFLFREELQQFEKEGTLTHLCVTFSRDMPEDGQLTQTPRYVQDLLRASASEICRLLTEHEALVYVCGDAKNMAKHVAAAFEDILIQEKEMTRDDANMFLMKKRLHKTYFEDVWV